jgi:hypothetical protein
VHTESAPAASAGGRGELERRAPRASEPAAGPAVRRRRRARPLRAGTLTPLPPRAQVGEGNLERRALRAEKLAMREMLYPVLQAEEDRRRAPGRRPAE